MTGGPFPGDPYQGGGMQPPPRPRRTSNGCLIWGLSGCGVLIIAFIVLMVIGTSTFLKGTGKGFLNGITSAPTAKQKLIGLRSALDAYRHDHKGQFPPSLARLVPNYLPDESDFSYTVGGEAHHLVYSPLDKSAPDDEAVAGFRTGDLNIGTSSQTLYVRLLKNGMVVQDQEVRTYLP